MLSGKAHGFLKTFFIKKVPLILSENQKNGQTEDGVSIKDRNFYHDLMLSQVFNGNFQKVCLASAQLSRLDFNLGYWSSYNLGFAFAAVSDTIRGIYAIN